jgi:hypothetical protein
LNTRETNSYSGIRINTHSCIIICSKGFETMESLYEKLLKMCADDMHVYVHLV